VLAAPAAATALEPPAREDDPAAGAAAVNADADVNGCPRAPWRWLRSSLRRLSPRAPRPLSKLEPESEPESEPDAEDAEADEEENDDDDDDDDDNDNAESEPEP
jgi:hypothetical protein